MSDAVYVLDAIVGFDRNDEATREASKYIPRRGYKQFLNASGLNGKRLGIVRSPFFTSGRGHTYDLHMATNSSLLTVFRTEGLLWSKLVIGIVLVPNV